MPKVSSKESVMTATVGGLVPTPPNNTTTFLRGDGTFAAPAAASTEPKIISCGDMERAGRNTSTTGSGTASVDTSGFFTATGITATSSALGLVNLANGNGYKIFDGNPKFSATFSVVTVASSDNPTAYCGIGEVTTSGSGHTFTNKHVGFKMVKSAGSYDLSGTQADGTTEATTSLSTGIAAGDLFDVVVTLTTASSATYYFRKNGGAWSAGATVSTNMPANADATTKALQFSVSNNSTAVQNSVEWNHYRYER